MPWTKVDIEPPDPVAAGNGSKGQRVLAYPESIREAFTQALESDSAVYLMGQGVDDPGGMFGTTAGLQQKFGADRVFDTPLSENGLMGVAVGSAVTGMRPIYLHNRPDFLLLAMDQIVNHAAKWRYMFGGHGKVPLVVWACTGRGWGSAAQHSQALQGLFMHIPGLRLVMPGTPYDAKGLLLQSVADDNPVIIIEHRWLFKQSGPVPEKMYRLPFGKGAVRRRGQDVTVAGVSHMLLEAQAAARDLEREGIEVEIIDFRTLKPLDKDLLLESVGKTGRLVLADNGWKCGGITAEITAVIAEEGFDLLRAPVRRVTCPDVPAPAGHTLEECFYPGVKQIKDAIHDVLEYR